MSTLRALPAHHDDHDTPATFTRVPPRDLHAEQAVLGALMTATGPSTRYRADTLDTGIQPADYYQPAHETIHRAIRHLHDTGRPVDLVTVADELTQRGDLDRIGGRGYLHTCAQTVPIASHGPHYAEIVRAKAYRRDVIAAAERILQYAYSDEGDENAVRATVEQELTDIINGTPGLTAAPPEVGEIYLDFVEELEEIQAGRQMGITYGLADLDAVTAGMKPGNVTVIAAGSGGGKSTLALNAAVAAAKSGAKVLFSSLEMSKTELMMKIAAAEGMVPLHHLNREGALSSDGWAAVERLGRELFATLPMRIYRPDGATLLDIASAARATVRAGGLDVLVVDYLQLIEVEQSRNVTREQAVASVSRGLKNLSTRLDCHVIALSQLNDDGMMRESRAIKNDASVVIVAERPDADEPASPRAGEVDLRVEKNRFGPLATITASARLHYSLITGMGEDAPA